MSCGAHVPTGWVRRWLASSGDSAWSGAFPGSLEAPGLLPPDFCAEEFRLPVGPHQRLTPGDAQTLGTRGCHHRVTSPCARCRRLRGPGMRPDDPHGVRDARPRGRPGPAASSIHGAGTKRACCVLSLPLETNPVDDPGQAAGDHVRVHAAPAAYIRVSSPTSVRNRASVRVCACPCVRAESCVQSAFPGHVGGGPGALGAQ